MHEALRFGTNPALVCSPNSPLVQLRSGITLLCLYRPFELSFLYSQTWRIDPEGLNLLFVLTHIPSALLYMS